MKFKVVKNQLIPALILVTLLLALAGCLPRVGSPAGLGGIYYPPVVGEELVYFSAADGYLYALNRDGEMLWREAPQGGGQELQPLVAGPALDPGRNLVVVGSEQGDLYAFNANDGSQEWKFPASGKIGSIWSTPVISNGVVYFGSHDKNVYAVNLDDGTLEWRAPTGGAVAGRPLLFRNLVVVGSFDKKLYGIDRVSGEKRWELEGNNWFWAGPVADERTIFAPSMDGNIYVVNQNGELLDTYDLGSPIVSRPVLVSGGLAVVAKDARDVFLLDTSPQPLGPERLIDSEFVSDADITASLFALGDRVYVSTQDSTLIRVDLTSPRNLEKEWCIDNVNTGEDSRC
jgi:outer membrane protein assembly factor BamB